MPIGAKIMPKMFYNFDSVIGNHREYANRGIDYAAKCFITLTIGENFIKLFYGVIDNTIKVTPVKTIGIVPIAV
jgi:hypothetical protein